MTTERWAKVHYLDASAIVKLVVEENGSSAIREFFHDYVANIYATDLCFAEAFGVLKGQWKNRETLTEDQYVSAMLHLASLGINRAIERDDASIFDSSTVQSVRELIERYSLDVSDALQLYAILRGKFSHLGPNSASVLISADKDLVDAAREEGIRAWNCLSESRPAWLA